MSKAVISNNVRATSFHESRYVILDLVQYCVNLPLLMSTDDQVT